MIKVGGAYHGWSDQMVYGLHIPGTRRLEATGIPRGVSRYTQEFFPHNLGQLRRLMTLNRLRGGTAAVIVEPLGPESGTRPVPHDFNQKLRELCDEFGALLIFDEVVTGFRLGLGGAQGYFGVRPDLTILGKCVTGGYPMAGGVGGRREVMQRFAPGIGGTVISGCDFDLGPGDDGVFSGSNNLTFNHCTYNQAGGYGLRNFIEAPGLLTFNDCTFTQSVGTGSHLCPVQNA